MRTVHCTVSFTDTRIKPRVVAVATTGTNGDARQAARKVIGDLHPTWEILMVKASGKAAIKPVGSITAKAKSTRKPKVANPDVKAAWAATLALGCVDPHAPDATQSQKDDFWGTYRALRADLRKLIGGPAD